MNQEIAKCLPDAPMRAFELMHAELDKVWDECFRVLKSGGFLCINIGEATRTVGNEFRLYNNSSRIVSHCTGLGMVNLPNILWRKQTNAPNKFMGSGMLPCGAYVTLEHEWILIFRKGGNVKAAISGKNATAGFPMYGISKARNRISPAAGHGKGTAPSRLTFLSG